MKIGNPNICKTKFSVTLWDATETENYYKKPVLIFAPYSFLIFLDAEMHEPKISAKTISELFGTGFQFFQEKFQLFRGVRYTKDRGLVKQI